MRVLFFLINILICSSGFAQDVSLNSLHMPPQFKINLFAHVEDARSMSLGQKGSIFVGSKDAGKVYAVIADPRYSHSTKIFTIVKNLNSPNGVAFHNGALYVATTDEILRFDQIEEHLAAPPKPVLIAKLPNKGGHNWHYIKFGPDDKLYIGMGAPCDSCLSNDPRFATIMRMNADGSDFEIYTHGVRNTVGFDWDPKTGKLWFTDNGRDWLGNNSPPDKINYAPTIGMHFGYPFFHGKNVPDPQYGKIYPKNATFPTYELPAHVAALGMTFYRGKMFPAEYQNGIFVAEHGSWNRSSKVGYQVIFAAIKDNQVTAVKPFVTGWLQNQKAWGRPVDLLELPDGSLLISDDFAGVIYRVSYNSN